MSDANNNEKPTKRKKKLTFFQTRRRKSGKASVASASTTGGPSADGGDGARKRRRKRRGLKAQIQGLVKGRTRKHKSSDNQSKNSFDKPSTARAEFKYASKAPAAPVEHKDVSTTKQLPPPPSPMLEDKEILAPVVEEDSGSELDDSVSLVILMVHSETLRFELLQLELESGEVTVKDILRHSAQNVTDSTLKKLCLEKLADREGNFYSGNTSLATILGGKQNNIVLVAVAKGITLEASHRLSTPILSDSKVVRMLENSGYDLTGWKDKSEFPKAPAVFETGFRVVSGALGGTLLLLLMYFIFQLYIKSRGTPPIDMIESMSDSIKTANDSLKEALLSDTSPGIWSRIFGSSSSIE